MIENGFTQFSGKNVLLLQGPIGPFFSRLARDLQQTGATVHKINFNSGDCLFYPRNFTAFNGVMEEWPQFLEQFLVKHKIDSILLFGDCRKIHRAAIRIASKRSIKVGVFEEGYLRPDFVTFEIGGVNGYSNIPKDPDFYLNQFSSNKKMDEVKPVGKTLHLAFLYSFLYWAAAILGKQFFPNYRHHRSLKASEITFYLRWTWAKYKFAFTEYNFEKELIETQSKNFYLVPMQVHNDSQIMVHSPYFSNHQFLNEVIMSFSSHAPIGTLLVFKQHPLDKGYHNYAKKIKELCLKHGVEASRVHYIHDQHLPTLLDHARGVILVNSTVGLQSIFHGCPTLVRGKAIYDMKGLTYQGSLDSFWVDSVTEEVNLELFQKFRNFLLSQNQLNGNIYKPVTAFNNATGMSWDIQEEKVEEVYDAISNASN